MKLRLSQVRHPSKKKENPKNKRGYILDEAHRADREKVRRANKRKQKRKYSATPIPPDTTPQNKTGSFELGSKNSSFSILNQQHLEDIQNDVQDLYPQLVKEIEQYSPTTGGQFRGINMEKKIWKRFIHAYARFLGNISKACDFCGISRNHVYRASERYPSLGLLLKLIDDRFVDEVEETTKRHSLLPNSIVERIFLLKVKRKEVYGEGDKNTPISVEVKFNNLSMMREPRKVIEVKANATDSGS